MSELGDIEMGMVNLLAAVQDGGVDVFAAVRGMAGTDRKVLTGQLLRELKPAEYVVFDERSKRGGSEGDPRLAVLLAGSSYRGGDEVRLGATDVRGGYELSDFGIGALHEAVVADDVRLTFQGERTVWCDGKTVVLEQTYAGRGVSSTTAATFGGQAIAGSDSVFDVVLGEIESESVAFGFPGIAGTFEHRLGVRDREILWEGQLRASDDAGLSAIESTLEECAADPTPRSMVDPWGRTHADVVLRGFARKGVRRVDRLTGKTVQDFVCRFRQLNPS